MTIAATPPTPSWPPPWARSIAFVAGLSLVIWEAAIDASTHMVVYAIGFILTGLPMAQGLEKLLDRVLPGGRG